MGAANSKVEEDKALQLCRDRKRFVKQALDGRSSFAEAHVAYVHSLKVTGTALRKFVEPESSQNESSMYTSTGATPDPLLPLTEKSLSQFSFSSPSFSQSHVDATESTVSPSRSPLMTTRTRADHMKFSGSSPREVEERVSSPATGTVIFSNSPPNATPRAADRPESSPFDGPPIPPGTPPWDFFGLFHPIDHQFSFQDGKGSKSVEASDDIRRLRVEEGIPDLEDDEEKASSNETGEESQVSEIEFDEPSMDTLVRRFDNVNRVSGRAVTSPSPSSVIPPVESMASEAEFSNRDGGGSPSTSNQGDGSPVVTPLAARNKGQAKEVNKENNIEPKDFISSIRKIELLFLRASASGNEVPRMLEANTLQLSLISPAKESVSLASVYLKACFSCGQKRRQVREEPAQTAIKYLAWHNMASSSPSSSNPLQLSSNDNAEVMSSNLSNNFGMVSGSHASTLDRLYAWERKLYDEVKASEIIRKGYDFKCKLLRQLESKAESSHKIDKIRADIKDLHSRITVAIHRIDSISKKIEELRDKELQPQLEELIEGLSRMWDVMYESHKLQYRIIAVAQSHDTKISVHSESRRQIILHLENELNYLSLSFTKWIGAQESYLGAINGWLLKCLPQRPLKKKKRGQALSLRDFGPPIYATCELWLAKLGNLRSKEVADSTRALAAEIRKFLPRQEKNKGKGTRGDSRSPASWEANNIDEASEDLNFSFDEFRSSLVGFLGKLNEYSESSVNMYRELKREIEEAKNKYERLKSRTQT